MTNRDPYRDSYEDRDLDEPRPPFAREEPGVGVGTIAAIAIAAILIVGGLFYAMSDRSSVTATNPAPMEAPATSGQGPVIPRPGPSPDATEGAK